ncbi:MAG: CYTH domain-containing protein [Gammaproteobacteria bacterium]|jgi:adenylate cyclase
MATEIERKFLVKDDSWRDLSTNSEEIIQGYLANTERGSIRVRIAGGRASLNIKSMTLGVTRTEYDYAIPGDDARAMLQGLCTQPLIEKTRHYIQHQGHTWEIDEFAGANAGLVVAELELKAHDETFQHPPWLGEEVSHDPRYYNVCLVEHPYKNW